MTLDDIFNKLHKVEQLILKQYYKPFNLVEASEYLSISQSHLYFLTRKRKIPCHKPTGKYLYFFRNELDEWIKNNSAVRCQKVEDPDGISNTEAFHRVKDDPASPHSGVNSEKARRDVGKGDEDLEWLEGEDPDAQKDEKLRWDEEKDEPP